MFATETIEKIKDAYKEAAKFSRVLSNIINEMVHQLYEMKYTKTGLTGAVRMIPCSDMLDQAELIKAAHFRDVQAFTGFVDMLPDELIDTEEFELGRSHEIHAYEVINRDLEGRGKSIPVLIRPVSNRLYIVILSLYSITIQVSV